MREYFFNFDQANLAESIQALLKEIAWQRATRRLLCKAGSLATIAQFVAMPLQVICMLFTANIPFSDNTKNNNLLAMPLLFFSALGMAVFTAYSTAATWIVIRDKLAEYIYYKCPDSSRHSSANGAHQYYQGIFGLSLVSRLPFIPDSALAKIAVYTAILGSCAIGQAISFAHVVGLLRAEAAQDLTPEYYNSLTQITLIGTIILQILFPALGVKFLYDLSEPEPTPQDPELQSLITSPFPAIGTFSAVAINYGTGLSL